MNRITSVCMAIYLAKGAYFSFLCTCRLSAVKLALPCALSTLVIPCICVLMQTHRILTFGTCKYLWLSASQLALPAFPPRMPVSVCRVAQAPGIVLCVRCVHFLPPWPAGERLAGAKPEQISALTRVECSFHTPRVFAHSTSYFTGFWYLVLWNLVWVFVKPTQQWSRCHL